MELIYKKYKNLVVKYPGDVEALVVGYCENNLILGCDNCYPSYSFRRLDKNTFIEEPYRDNKWRYFYCTENTLLKQYPKIK